MLDIFYFDYTPKKKKMFGLLSSSSEQIELGNWILRQLRAKSDATAAFVFNTFNEWFANTTIATIKLIVLLLQRA